MLRNKTREFIVSSPPTDTVQCLRWAPSDESLIFCSASWDGSSSIWKIEEGNDKLKSTIKLKKPLLSATWDSDLSAVYLGCCDSVVYKWDLEKNIKIDLGAHFAPVSEVFWCEEAGLLISGSFDSTVRFWDLRCPNPVSNIYVGCVEAMSLKYPLLVCLIDDNKIAVLSLQLNCKVQIKPNTYNTSSNYCSVGCFPNAEGFVAGCSDGICEVNCYDNGTIVNDYHFKCHNNKNYQYSEINCLVFNPETGSFATAGDSSICFWDKDEKKCLRKFELINRSVSAIDFHKSGKWILYATERNWNEQAANFEIFYQSYEETKYSDNFRKSYCRY